jgi:hypothetical protein
MNKNKLKYIIVSIIVLIIGIIILINFKSKNSTNRCGDNAFFEYNKDTKTVTIKGTGVAYLTGDTHYKFDMIDRGSSIGGGDYQQVGKILFPAEVEKIIVSEGITSIKSKSGEVGTYLEEGGTYKNLKEIVLPNTIEELGIGCFANQTNLEKINIPNTIKKIPDYAFYNCKRLNKIVLPEDIKVIGNFAFYKCDNLYNINFPRSLKMIEDSAFSECATLSEVKLQNIRYIGRSAFEKCYNLTTVEIYGDIQELYSYTFDVCLNLKNVRLTENIKQMANDTFRNCSILQTNSLFENIDITIQYVKDRKEIQELEDQIMNE